MFTLQTYNIKIPLSSVLAKIFIIFLNIFYTAISHTFKYKNKLLKNNNLQQLI